VRRRHWASCRVAPALSTLEHRKDSVPITVTLTGSALLFFLGFRPDPGFRLPPIVVHVATRIRRKPNCVGRGLEYRLGQRKWPHPNSDLLNCSVQVKLVRLIRWAQVSDFGMSFARLARYSAESHERCRQCGLILVCV